MGGASCSGDPVTLPAPAPPVFIRPFLRVANTAYLVDYLPYVPGRRPGGTERGSIAGGPTFSEVFMTELQLLYLCRLLDNHLESLERRLARNRRFYDPNDEVLQYRKVVLVENEIQELKNARQELAEQLAKMAL